MPAQKVITKFIPEEKLYTNIVVGLQTDLFRRYANKDSAIKDGEIISIWLSIPHEIENETNTKLSYKERGASKTENAKLMEKVTCPSSSLERSIFIESLKTEKGGFTAEDLAKIGVYYPLKKGWRENAIKNGW